MSMTERLDIEFMYLDGKRELSYLYEPGMQYSLL